MPFNWDCVRYLAKNDKALAGEFQLASMRRANISTYSTEKDFVFGSHLFFCGVRGEGRRIFKILMH